MSSDSGSIQFSGHINSPQFTDHKLERALSMIALINSMIREGKLEEVKNTFSALHNNPHSRAVEELPYEKMHFVHSDHIVIHHKPSGMHIVSSAAGPAAAAAVLAHAKKTNPAATVVIVPPSAMADVHAIILASPLATGQQSGKRVKTTNQGTHTAFMRTIAGHKPAARSDADDARERLGVRKLSLQQLQGLLKNVNAKLQNIRNVEAARQKEKDTVAQERRQEQENKDLHKAELEARIVQDEIKRRQQQGS